MIKYFFQQYNQTRVRHKQSGSALLLTLFILVVLILLGSALMRVLSTSSESIAQEVIGTRAYMAANSAMQAELQKLFPLNTTPPVCNLSFAYDFSASGLAIEGLPNCKATTQCILYATNPITLEEFYRLTSTGKCESATLASDSKSVVVSSRTIQVEARDL